MKKLRIPFIIPLVITSAFLLRGKIAHEKFNSELWKTADLNSESNWSLRWEMMNDLRNKHKLIGMTKGDVLKLLGEPEDIGRNEFRYYLGYSKTGINTGTLTIKYSDKNIVKEIRVWEG